MARKKVTADLNGGDAVTAMGDLQFQIHDGISDSIIATANYAAIGSVNSNGTDGANITYTLNLTGGTGGNGQIVLDGVDIGASTSIKIRCKDEAGNESILSAAFASSIILFTDDFAGATIDLAKWNVLNNSAGNGMDITQNNELIWTSGAPATTLDDDNLISDNSYAGKVFSFDFQSTNATATGGLYGIQIRDAAGDNVLGLERPQTGTNLINFFVKDATVKVYDASFTKDVTSYISFKMVIGASTIKCYYWDGVSAWVEALSYTGGISATNFFIKMLFASDGGAEVDKIDNMFFSDSDFNTQYPS